MIRLRVFLSFLSFRSPSRSSRLRGKNIFCAAVLFFFLLNPCHLRAQTALAEVSTAAERLEKSRGEVQRLKDAWDKARLETTLYDQRSKRAYQKWVKAAKKAREQTKLQKEKAELELQLAIEKRKLAFSLWQSAQW